MLLDSHERLRALDSTTSFIVQAPAGSGKTELLTQRFLVLLNTVNIPEEILAITFTKKSANEMRVRIINTLKNAQLSQIEPASEHSKKTWNLAKAVLKRDQDYQWDLLSNPNRLKIQTIDSFNSSLTKQLPILSQFGAAPDIADYPLQLYQEAVTELLSHLEENVSWSHSIAYLLKHLDNDIQKLEKQLILMLSKRDQWLPHIIYSQTEEQRKNQLEQGIFHVIQDTLTTAYEAIPKDIIAELISVLHYSAEHCKIENPASTITNCLNITSLNRPLIKDLPIWLGISEFFLKKDCDWRKQLTKNEGFPPVKKDKLNPSMKEKALTIIDSQIHNETLRLALEELRYLPSYPITENEWQLLSSLQTVLHISVAQLKLVFQRYGKIDYIENALAAITALGQDEMPTDLALSLDYRIQHILVDEFQDTSTMQYSLLKKLTAGWTPHDGRTLFVVGDPMQSIYRFREAEVGLFIRARKTGIGSVPLEPLTLSVNFRSTPAIVNWVNEHFKQVFPSVEEISSGAVTYSHSVARDENSAQTSAVELHPFFSDATFEEQATKTVDLVNAAKMQDPKGKIAILVRTRSHLKSIIPALKAAKIPYRAIKIDALSLRPIIQDLLSLTRALLHPADRIAWLALLRAPWCGITLDDLLVLTNDESNVALYTQIQSPLLLNQLSKEGKKRLQRISLTLIEKIKERRRLSLRTWIESTWIALGGAACAEQASDIEDAAAFFALLEKLDQGSDLLNTSSLVNAVTQLFASGNNEADNSVQIMTIHNSKGLEFDTVIIPHLELSTLPDERQLLLWMERPSYTGESDLILSPIAQTGKKNSATYEHIKRQLKLKSQHEDARLLYVAATRAKKQLHFLFSAEITEKNEIKTPSSGLLGKLWPAIQTPNVPRECAESSVVKNTRTSPGALEVKPLQSFLKRLTLDWKNPVVFLENSKKFQENTNTNEFSLPDHTAKIIGIIIHKIIQQLCQFGIAWWSNRKKSEKAHYIQFHLKQAGIGRAILSSCVEKIYHCIERMIKDPQGQWILSSHTHAASEYPITTVINNEIFSFVIDRTFIDEHNTRWIIDFKTAHSTNEDSVDFFEKQKKKYEPQLLNYIEAFKNQGEENIKAGLYFPMTSTWMVL